MPRRKKGILIFALFFALFFLTAYGRLNCQDEITKLLVGQNKVLSCRAPTRIAIGNPAVADIAEVTNTEITVSGKARGSTTLVYWDAFGEQSLKIMVVNEDMAEVKARVDNLLKKLDLPEVYTQAEDEEERVFILGRVKTAQDRERIATALGALKDKTVDLVNIKEDEAVVEIDVQILELDQGATNTLGITWPGGINLLEKGSPGISAAGTKWGTLFKVLDLQRGTSAGTDPFSFKLDALIQEGKARVLSRPRLACQSGKEAQMLVGGEKPLFTTAVESTVGTSTNVEYKEFGIKLKIKPTVSGENRIKLGLNVEVSDVGEAETIGATNAPTAKAYPLTKRTASTELFLDNGSTLAIGGLIKQKTEEELRKFPWLADMPVLGIFFRQRVTKKGSGYSTKGDTELFITLTPTIVSRDKGADQGGEPVIKAEPTTAPAAPSAPVSPLASAASARTQQALDPIADYGRIVQGRVLENLIYPATAKKAMLSGTVKLRLHLSYLGKLLDAQIKDPSGYNVLDESAISAAQSISSFPPFPATIQQSDLWIEVPIIYKAE